MSKANVIARRRTYDNKLILLWSDGDITNGHVGALLSRRVPADAAWLVMGEVCLYDLKEVKAMIQIARKAINQRRVTPLEHLRNRMAGRKLQNVDRKWACQEWK
jgi:hypothetical protein